MFKKFLIWHMILSFLLIGCASMESRYKYAVRVDKIDTYKAFIRDYPDSPYIHAIKDKIEVLQDTARFEEAQQQNSISAYNKYAQKYPNGQYAQIARQRASQTDEEAFIRTCQLGSVQAYKGFADSYSNSKYLPVVKDRLIYWGAVQDGTLASFKSFVKQYPGNMFAGEAKAAIPILWLAERKKVGLFIDVGDIVKWKGIFRGGNATKEEIRLNLYKNMKKDLEKEGIDVVLLEQLADLNGNIYSVLITMSYKETEASYQGSTSQYSGSSGVGLSGYTSRTLSNAAADNLSAALTGLLIGSGSRSVSSFTVKDVRTGFEYYSNITNLNERVSMSSAATAVSINSSDAMPLLTVAINDTEPSVRLAVARALGNLNMTDKSGAMMKRLLNEESPVVRREAVKAMLKWGKSVTEPIMGAMKRDQDWGVRFEAACSLAQLGITDTMQVDTLIEALKRVPDDVKDTSTIYNQTKKKKRKKTKTAVTVKTARKVSPSDRSNARQFSEKNGRLFEIKMRAVAAMAEVQDSRVIAPLIALIDCGNTNTETMVLKTLKNKTGKDFGSEKEKWVDWWLNDLAEKQNITLLFQAVKTGDADIKMNAMKALENLRSRTSGKEHDQLKALLEEEKRRLDSEREALNMEENLAKASPQSSMYGSGQGAAKDAIAMVRKATDHINRYGASSAFDAFNNPKGSFVYRDLYIYVIDMDGEILAHGANRALIGKNLIKIKDSDGKRFIEEIISVANNKGNGWVDYNWTNPVSKKIEGKSTYIQRVGNDMIIGCGINK